MDKYAEMERLAAWFCGSLVEAERPDGTTYYTLLDGAPEWMRDLCREAHGDMMPDDTRYRMIREAAQILTEHDACHWDDSIGEMADSIVDIYTSSLARWMASHLLRVSYCDQARDDLGVDESADMERRLMAGQYIEYTEIIAALINRFDELADDEIA